MSLHSKSKTPIHHLLNRLLSTRTRFIQTVSFEEITTNSQPKHTAFILHGLLGSARNWRSFAKSLSSSLSPNWRLILIDLRNHGNSAFNPNLTPPHNMQNTAKDLTDLIQHNKWTCPDVVIGHSLGGKVALQFAKVLSLSEEENLKLKQVWVLDSVPGKVVVKGSDEGEVERVLRTLQGLDGKIESRKWLVEHMIGLGFSDSLSQWIGSNLRNVEGKGMRWGFDLNGAVGMFESYREMDYWDMLESPPDGMEINVVRAEKSDRWDEEVVKGMDRVARDGKVKAHLLRDAGHWVHVDNPKGLLEIIAPSVGSID